MLRMLPTGGSWRLIEAPRGSWRFLEAPRGSWRLLEVGGLMFAPLCFSSADLPSFSEPHIPLVAREIMQRMIRQYAAEYTSKTTQDAPPPHAPPPHAPPPHGAMKDRGQPRAPLVAMGSPPGPSSPQSPASSTSSSSSSSSSSSPRPGPGLSPTSPSGGGGGGGAAASTQNPVLSKLLLADQDGPLDLSVKKSEPEPDPTQEGE